ncbi:MAG: ATP-binding cassette domain-containing protein [Jiangellales bacterium]
MLSVRDLTKQFGSLRALDAASFEARPGRIVGFLGPNGAGKTTAMRCIFGLVEPDAGEVTWQGAPVTTTSRLTFGYMPEERGMYPKMKIAEQLRYLGRLSGMSAADAAAATDDWLGRLGLADRGGATLEQLSHGNKQRVQLAAALVHSPVLAVLDEPFAGLDPLGTDALARELRALAAAGTCIVFSSHQLDLVQDVCQDVVIVDHGRVVRTGTLDELRSGTRMRRLAVEVDGAPWRPSVTSGLDVLDVPDEPGLGADHHVLLADDVPVEDILEAARSAGRITSVVYEPPSLSDVFRAAVSQ